MGGRKKGAPSEYLKISLPPFSSRSEAKLQKSRSQLLQNAQSWFLVLAARPWCILSETKLARSVRSARFNRSTLSDLHSALVYSWATAKLQKPRSQLSQIVQSWFLVSAAHPYWVQNESKLAHRVRSASFNSELHSSLLSSRTEPELK